VTEAVTHEDLVEWQLRVASGQPLPKKQEELTMRGHAIEARIYAEDPSRNFMPTAGTLFHLKNPTRDAAFSYVAGNGVRIDGGFDEGDRISTHYDPMFAKLIVTADNRGQALQRMNQALSSYQVVGVDTNIEFLRRASQHPAFVAGGVDTSFIAKYEKEILTDSVVDLQSDSFHLVSLGMLLNGPSTNNDARFFRVNSEATKQFSVHQEGHTNNLNATITVHSPTSVSINGATVSNIVCSPLPSVDPAQAQKLAITADIAGRRVAGTVVFENIASQSAPAFNHIHVFCNTLSSATSVQTKFRVPAPAFLSKLEEATEKDMTAPMPAEVRKVFVTAGQHVKKGDRLVVLVAMKMEVVLSAPFSGVVSEVMCKEGLAVPAGAHLIAIDRDADKK